MDISFDTAKNTANDDVRRIISLRKANLREVKRYAEA